MNQEYESLPSRLKRDWPLLAGLAVCFIVSAVLAITGAIETPRGKLIFAFVALVGLGCNQKRYPKKIESDSDPDSE